MSSRRCAGGEFWGFMAALIDAIDIKRKAFFEFESAPYCCLEADISTPTARGGQTLVRLKMRNLLTQAVFEKSFKAGEKFKEPDLEIVPASYLYTDGDGSHFLDQESFETLTLSESMVGNGLDLLVDGMLVQLHKYNGNPIGLQLPLFVELTVAYAEPGAKGKLVQRERDQDRPPGDWTGTCGTPVYQGGRQGSGLYGKSGVLWSRLSDPRTAEQSNTAF